MNLALKRGISKWEHSGQGDGGYTCDDDGSINTNNDDGNEDEDSEDADGETNRFGDLSSRSQRALDLGRNFLMIGTPISFIYGML